MSSFKQKYLDLLIKRHDFTQQDSYFADEVKGFNGILVGISSQNHPCILIEGGKNDSKGKNISNLNMIEAEFGVNCKVLDSTNKQIDGCFNIITYKEEGGNLLDFFFKFFEDLLNDDNNKSSLKLKDSILNLSKLFSHKKSSPRKTMMGLWSELYIILVANDSNLWAEKWHKRNRSTFDFVFDKKGLDVKSFGGHNREHFFKIEQLNNQTVEQTLVLSLCLRESEDGVNVFDLFEDLKKKISRKSNIEKIQKLIFKLAGKDIKNSKRYNPKIAHSTLLLFKASDIPKLDNKNTPLGVSEIKFKSDCSKVKGFKFDKKNQNNIISSKII